MLFSWATDFNPNAGMPTLGSYLLSLVLSYSPFKHGLKSSPSALPTHGLESLSLFQAGKPYLLPAGLVPCKTPHEQKKPEFHQWHQSLSHMLIRGLFLLAFFSATEGIEGRNIYAPVLTNSYPSDLKYFLIALGLLSSVSLLPTWATTVNDNQCTDSQKFRESSSNISHPGSREAADFSVEWVLLAYESLSSPQKKVTGICLLYV